MRLWEGSTPLVGLGKPKNGIGHIASETENLDASIEK